jgi:hypothetical protein
MRALVRILAMSAVVFATITPVGAGTRLKDILDVEGVRDNQLLGYGVVVGVNGTGDSLRNQWQPDRRDDLGDVRFGKPRRRRPDRDAHARRRW